MDPIADMITRMRNASAVRKATVDMPYSSMKAEVARVLQEEGFIGEAKRVEVAGKPTLRVSLKYYAKRNPAIRTISKVSTPGCRRYVKAESIPVVMNDLGIAIISTSRGVMTNKAAKKMNVGGEVICEVS